MTHRSRQVMRFFPERQPSQRLRGQSDACRVAAEAFETACEYGCSGDIAEALYALYEREAAAYQAKSESDAR